MADFLTKILGEKKHEVEMRRRVVSEDFLEDQIEKTLSRRGFYERLSHPGPFGANIVAEIKRGSPSRGVLRADLDAAQYAAVYEDGGAAALSVLTDAKFFHGSGEDLREARSASKLPVLRKDFIISTYQVFESAVMGADAVLLIVRAVSPVLLRKCLELCGRLGLDALVEVHSQKEFDAASDAGARLIGINNRDLSTFRTDIRMSIDLAGKLRKGQVAVSESGIHGRDQIEMLLDAGIWNFLIGESLVTATDPKDLLHRLLGRKENRERAGNCGCA